VGHLFGYRAVCPTWADPGQIQAIVGHPSAQPKGRFVDHRDQRDPTAQCLWLQAGHQQADGGHWLELVAVDAAGDQQVRTGLKPFDVMASELHETLHSIESQTSSPDRGVLDQQSWSAEN
jgi:hypothetical protein